MPRPPVPAGATHVPEPPEGAQQRARTRMNPKVLQTWAYVNSLSARSSGQGDVAALAGQQAGVRPRLGDLAVVQDGDLVGVAHGGQPVRDGDRGAALRQAVERLLHRALG